MMSEPFVVRGVSSFEVENREVEVARMLGGPSCRPLIVAGGVVVAGKPRAKHGPSLVRFLLASAEEDKARRAAIPLRSREQASDFADFKSQIVRAIVEGIRR